MIRLWLVAVAVTAAVVGALAPTAAASSGAPALEDRTRVWLEATLRAEIIPRPVMQADTADCAWVKEDLSGCQAISYQDRVEFDAVTWRQLGYVATNRRDPWGVGQVMIHELLHDWHAPGTPTDLEEGIAEAVSTDLYAAWGRMVGLRGSWPAGDVYSTMYPAQVRAVRTASVRATGSPWKSRAARLWRRDLWRADTATRLTIYQGAWSSRGG